MKEEVVPVGQQLNTIVQQQIAKNRTIMASLFKTVLFCGRNNTAFSLEQLIDLFAQMHPRRIWMANILYGV